MIERQTNKRFLVAATVIVGAAGLANPKVGGCGTCHYLVFHLLGGLVVSALDAVHSFRGERFVADAVSTVLNATLFLAVASFWYIFSPRRWFVLGLLLWTTLYLTSYFFGIRASECP